MSLIFKMKFVLLIFYTIFANISLNYGDSPSTYRLPNEYISVYSYNLRMVPFLENDFNFNGEVKIVLYASTTVDCFTLNIKDFKITDINVFSDRVTYTWTHEVIPDKEMLKICVSTHLTPYKYITVQINFSGKINDDFKGLYKIPYRENGVEKWLVSTQFEPTYARLAFPCFDEPEYKAKFRLIVANYPHQMTYSITKLAYISAQDPKMNNRRWYTFDETKRISPYIMSFTVHEFTSTTGNMYVNVYSRLHTAKDTKFFLSIFNRLWDEIQTYLNSMSPNFPKDLTAVPDADEYSRKAGLICYSEKDVLHIDGVDVKKHKEEIARTSVHKMSHIWLGEYAAPYWWDDTWLMESFATFFEYFITSKVEPTWRMDDLFNVEVLQMALYDEINFNVALSTSTGHPSEIQNQKFNSLVNKKGASVIRMLENIVKKDGFEKALRDTLTESKKKGILEPQVLWDQMQKRLDNYILPPGETIQSVMTTWITYQGYPLVKIHKTEPGNLLMEQETYRSPLSLEEIPDQIWKIPINCIRQSSSAWMNEKPIWLMGKKEVTTNSGLKRDEWVVCNSMAGYYRVNYDAESWALIIEQLKTEPNKIDTKNRAQLIDDSFHLALSHKLSFSIAFQLGMYLEKEEDMIPWLSVSKHITNFLQLFEGTSVADYLKNYFARLLKPQYDRNGFNFTTSDSYSVKTIGSTILAMSCHLEVEGCDYEVSQIYNNNINDLTKIPSELKYVVYCNSFRTTFDTETAWNKLWMIYKNSKITNERALILQTLGCANDKILLRRYLEMIIRQNDSSFYKYEKEQIMKSVSLSLNGIAAGLEVIEGMLPELNAQTEETIQTLILISDQIGTNVHLENHLSKIAQIITAIKTNEKINSVLLNSLEKSYALGMKKKAYVNENSDEIKHAIHEITGYTPPTTTQSSAEPTTTTSPSSTTQQPSQTSTNPAHQTQRSDIISPQTKPYDTSTISPIAPSKCNFIIPTFALNVLLSFGLMIYHIL